MEKVLMIGGIECRLKTSAALPRLYRLKFGEDLIIGFQKLFEETGRSEGALSPESINTLEQFAYICNKYADPSQPDNIVEWLEQFDNDAAIYMVMRDLIDLWSDENDQASTAKKNSVEQPG